MPTGLGLVQLHQNSRERCLLPESSAYAQQPYIGHSKTWEIDSTNSDLLFSILILNIKNDREHYGIRIETLDSMCANPSCICQERHFRKAVRHRQADQGSSAPVGGTTHWPPG
jgi:hypothetical protein